MRPVTPLITVDALIELADGSIVLVKRRYPPPGWAIPGGFVDPGESLQEAVCREAKEETSLDVSVKEIFHIYSRPWRDPRGDTVSVIYYCTARGKPQGGDDAAEAVAFDPEHLPEEIAFDHEEIIRDFLHWRSRRIKP